MRSEASLRSLARRAIRAGKLPRRRPDRTWGGPGAGAPCAVCAQSIRPDQVEYELQFADAADAHRMDRFQMHLRCFAVWELERTKPS
jgi:hypothetical protein